MKDFKETTSYQIVNHLYDERKDFIILGLCGKVGSGVTETANILEKTFDELYLPVPRYLDLEKVICILLVNIISSIHMQKQTTGLHFIRFVPVH